MTGAARKRVEILDRRPAGPDHQVITTKGGGLAYRRTPCPQCPWRIDAVGVFPAEAFKHSAPCAYDMAQRTFACHDSGQRHPATCAGFLLRNAQNNLSVRFRLALGNLNPDEVNDAGLALHPSYRAMAIANGVDPDDPVLAPCRDNSP